jgi:DNA-binding MarR family transcriptional regulator
MKEYDYQKLDSVLHSRIRLAITSVLVSCEKAEFTYLRDMVHATDGNINTHLKKLEEASYVSVEKKFVDRKPITYYQLTTKGMAAFKKYIDILETFIEKE